MESKEKKKERIGILWVYVYGGQNVREKTKEKKKKHMAERKVKNKKSQFKITTTIFL